ncbi:PQQ-binding-like beta-propeller repeat protein [Candidatus Poribacteria bacterium]|nr:PQQ-binding-like beta-propeller repeat protein [Candidatus Poribacteria bacterium]
MNHTKKGIRLWPLVILLCLGILSIGYVWIREAGHRQDKFLLTQLLLILAGILGVIWLLGLSRLTWKTKFKSFALIFVSILTFIFLFQFDGFSGDLVPKFELRWGGSAISSIAASNVQDTPDKLTNDFPQFLGPNRNAVLSGITLNTNWEETPPELVWRIPVGAGWSGFAVVGNSAITQEQEDEWEKVVCYDLNTGKEKWTHKDNARYYTSLGGLGPRATPTIDGNQVYTVGSTGILNCLDFESGRHIWSTNIFEENNAEKPPWGVAVSPLIIDNLVIVSAGGAVAYHKDSGEIAWTGHRVKSAYSSPVLLTLGGTEQVVLFDHGLVTSHEPSTGKLLWKQAWPSRVECAAQPIPLPGDKLLVSTAYGIGSKLFQISKGNQSEKFIVDLLWETIRFKAKFTTVIYHKNYLYGLDDGIFACIDPSDGTRQWKKGRYGHGQTLLIGEVLLVLTESGDIVLLKPDPEKHTELARIKGITGQTWNNPALTGNLLLVRNSQEAACYRLQTQ